MACSERAARTIETRHETGSAPGRMAQYSAREESDAIPSLIDDVAFLAELDEMLDAPALVARPIVARPVVARPVVAPPIAALVIPRDANRWNLASPPGVEPPERTVPRARPAAWVPILIGLCAGAAGSMALFHDRVALIVRLLAR